MARKIFVFFLTLLICLPAVFAEMIDGINYDEKYFGPIAGIVYGSAPPAINKIIINGRTIKTNEQGDFKAPVQLAANEKHVLVEIETNGYNLSKKYLVVRHPKTTRSFEIAITRSEFFKLMSLAPKKPPSAEATTTTILQTSNSKPQTPKQPKTSKAKTTNTTGTTLNYNTTTLQKQPTPLLPKPPSFPIPQQPKKKKGFFDWFKSLLSKKEPPAKTISPAVEETIKNEAIIIVQRDSQQIIRGEIKDYLGQEATNQAIYEILQREAPTALEKEVNKIIARDVPTGEGLSLIKQEIAKVVKREAPKIIEKETTTLLSSGEGQRIIEKQVAKVVAAKLSQVSIANLAKQAVNKADLQNKARATIIAEAKNIASSDTLLQLADKTIKEQALGAIDSKTLKKIINRVIKEETQKVIAEKAQEIIKTETQGFLKAQAEEQAKTQVKPPSLITNSGKWGGYDLVWEIEPGKLLLVKDTSKKYAGHIYYVREQLWMPLDELTPEQLRAVLNKGKFPIIKK